MAKIEWKDIREQYLYGIRAEHNGRTAEVVQAYEGEWLAFLAPKAPTGKKAEYLPFADAKKIARNWLLGKD